MADLINDFLGKNVIDSLSTLLSSKNEAEIEKSAKTIVSAFASGGEFDTKKDNEARLIESFRRNLSLLIEKTWVEQFDVSLKDEVLYKLSQFCEQVLSAKSEKWSSSYRMFLKILNDVVYLMFGSQAKSDDFDEYALRIDPEFGIFWWYVKSLPTENDWSDEKNRVVEMVALFFLANY